MKALFSILAAVAVFSSAYYWKNISALSPTGALIEEKLSDENMRFELVDPSQAPAPIKKYVMRGYNLMLHTHELLPDHVNDLLNCANCHFSGGITTGGIGGGISLAGVAAKYPACNLARNIVQDLPARINDCFRYSMSGKPLPADSQDMLALVTYLTWISSKYPIYVHSPWLGLAPLKTEHQPNEEKGKQLYAIYCATCHGDHGQGGNLDKNHPGTSFPPLWGPKSFHTYAGMNKLQTISSFIYYNMPFEEPQLSVENAIDIGAFVVKQPRPGSTASSE